MKKKNGIRILLIMSVLAFALCATFLGASCKDKIIENNVVLQLNKTQMNLVIGDSEQLETTYKNGGNETVIFTSSNEEIVTVNRGGVVTAINTGTATVQASYAGKTATCQVTVGLGEFVPVLEMTAITDNQITVSMMDKVNLDGVVYFNGETYDDCTLTYSLSDNTMGEIVDGKLTPFKTGEVTVVVSASWRGVTPEVQETLNVSVAVKIIDSVQFFINGEMVDSVKLYSMNSWGGETFQNSIPFNVTALINGEQVEPNVSVIGGEQFITLENDVLTAVKAGQSQLELSCVNNQKEYTVSMPIEIIRPIVKFNQTITNFSFADGEFDLADIFGESIILTDAYQDGESVQINGDKLVGLKSNSVEKTVSEITLYTEYAGYSLDVEGYTKVIDTEEEMKAFIVNAGEGATVTGYNFIGNDFTISLMDVVGWKDRYFKNGVLDGNGHTLNVTMGTGWSFGLFGQMTNATVKNLNINVIETDKYSHTNNNVNAVLAHLANNSTFENISLQIKGTVATPVSALHLIRKDQMEGLFKNFVVNIDDGILAENATIYGMNSNSSDCYVFSSIAVDYSSEKFVHYTSVSSAIENGENFKSLSNSGWWILDQESDMLVWKPLVDKTVTVLVNGVSGDKFDVTMQSNLTVKANYFDLELTPTLTILQGEDVVSIDGNEITALDKVGTATIKATFIASGQTIERVISIVVGYAEYSNGAIRLSEINKKAFIPDGLTPIKITDANGVVYYQNGAWDWSKITAPKSMEVGKKVLYVETADGTSSVQTEIYAGIISSEEDFKYFAGTKTPYIDSLTSSTNWAGQKSRKGYFIMVADIHVDGTPWSGTSDLRYFEDGVFDGNGHTLTFESGGGWSFGVFSNTYNVKIQNLRLDFIAKDGKFGGNQNKACIIGYDMKNTVIENCYINITETGTETAPLSKLWLTAEWGNNRAVMRNVVINVGDGIVADNASTFGVANNWTINGEMIETHNCFIISNNTFANNERTLSFASVEDMAKAEYSWKGSLSELIESDWWSYNEQNKTLAFGKKSS